MKTNHKPRFSNYQKLLLFVLSCLLFTIVLDFMLLPALSAVLLPELELTTKEFGWVVSAYTFSAGTSAFVASGYADQFDRKRFLMFFYSGFLVGLLLCTQAHSYAALFAARIITGIFGGVVGTILGHTGFRDVSHRISPLNIYTH